MSVDPDDLTPGAIKRYADRVVTYGLPVLPGSMVCIAYCADGTQSLVCQGAYCSVNRLLLMKLCHASSQMMKSPKKIV